MRWSKQPINEIIGSLTLADAKAINLRKFFTLAQISKYGCKITPLSIFSLGSSAQGSDLAPILRFEPK